MKTKQTAMRASFSASYQNAKNMSPEKETITQWRVIDKRTEKTVVDCRAYMGRSASASTIYASVWIVVSEKKKPQAWEYAGTSGCGKAGGYGYCKKSAAVQDAIGSAGIRLSENIGGRGERSIRGALCAIAYAAGFSDCIFVD